MGTQQATSSVFTLITCESVHVALAALLTSCMSQGIEREYQELDTVWFMAGSLFKNYPYDIPTEAFSLALFTQAFATVQASIVHLQDVTLSKRFALVPLGPPLLSYSSTSKVRGYIFFFAFAAPCLPVWRFKLLAACGSLA